MTYEEFELKAQHEVNTKFDEWKTDPRRIDDILTYEYQGMEITFVAKAGIGDLGCYIVASREANPPYIYCGYKEVGHGVARMPTTTK